MHYDVKIAELRGCIRSTLMPLIIGDCILADAPYYDNIGDVLIWQGINDFLRSSGRRLVQTNSGSTFNFPELSPEVTILLMGGGNFGDLWRWFQDVRLEIIKRYPDNRIVMFPQSVWYDDTSMVAHDAEIMGRHPDLHLCARDNWSYDFMKRNFSTNNIYLVPDMAFCIDESVLNPYRNSSQSGKRLFLKRLDKEISAATPLATGLDAEVRDWPTIEHKPVRFWIGKFIGLAHRLVFFRSISNMICRAIDYYATDGVRDELVKIGCRFLAPYGEVITTRLHAMILSVLLYKPMEYIDNTTGKLSAFAETWLCGLNQVKRYNG